MNYRVEVYYECVPDLEEPDHSNQKLFIYSEKAMRSPLKPWGISRTHVRKAKTTCLVPGFPIYGSNLKDQCHPENGKQCEYLTSIVLLKSIK